MKFSNGSKIYRLPSGAYLACAGDADIRDILTIFEETTLPTKKELIETRTEFQGISVFPDNRVFSVFVECDPEYGSDNQWSAQLVEIQDDIIALGSGLEFAYGVLEIGGTPKEAVEAACKRSIYCGLPVQVVSISEEPNKKRTRKKV